MNKKLKRLKKGEMMYKLKIFLEIRGNANKKKKKYSRLLLYKK